MSHDNQNHRLSRPPLTRRHLTIGWWSLVLFATLGLVLEALHGFKVGWYLDVDNETRRLMWRLAHAHGALLGLVHIGYACTIAVLGNTGPQGRLHWASLGLITASLLLPGGFLLGGVAISGGDPGLGVLLVPVGALAFLGSLVLVASSVGPGR